MENGTKITETVISLEVQLKSCFV